MELATKFFLLFSLLHFHKIHAAELSSISDSRFLTDGDTLVSPKGIFELGFFQPGISKNTYLGIWYKKVSARTVVWVANRNRSLPSASSNVLRISDKGILVLYHNISEIVWSTNISLTRHATGMLLDTGNLVVMDQASQNILWQSFDYPTDTFLPDMKLGKDYSRGLEWHLSSWKNSQDPGLGGYTWSADTHGYPQLLLKQGESVKYRSGPWSNQRISGPSQFGKNLILTYTAVVTEREVSFTYNIGNSSILTRFTLNSNGELKNTVWLEYDKEWQTTFTLPRDMCDTYNICSAYGSCSINTVTQSCACLDEKRFVPRNQKGWDAARWMGGCVRRTTLDCNKGLDGFMKYLNVKLPDTHSSWYNTSMTLKECEAKCLKNCTCVAYANTDSRGEGSGCLIWVNDLMDIRVYPNNSGGRDIYVRLASSELVAPSISKEKGGANIKIILIVIFSGVLIGFISTWCLYARRKRKHVESTGEGEVVIVSGRRKEAMELPLFSFSTIANATANFSPDNKLGEGGFGPMYKGLLREGLEIAVKRLSRTSSQGVDEFKNEVICVSKLQHRNLVRLLGCCIQGDEKLLIYEYMPNGSLDSFIFDKAQSMLLDWIKRFNIIIGIARGLVYLHQDSRLRIIHRDLKASNILLDQDMNPKISDFGIARSFGGNETQANTERVVGTYGYMSPEYALDGLFSIKSDVFSFGVLVLEIVNGNRNRGFIQSENDNNLIGHAWNLYSEGRSMELIDATLAESCYPPEVLRSIEVGLLCVQQNAGDRPNMSDVIQMLGGERAAPQPKQPAFYMEKELWLTAEFSSSTNPASSINDLTITELVSR